MKKLILLISLSVGILCCNKRDENLVQEGSIQKQNIKVSKNLTITSKQEFINLVDNNHSSPLENMNISGTYTFPSSLSTTSNKVIKYGFENNNYNLYEFLLKNNNTKRNFIGLYFENKEKKDGFVLYKEIIGNHISFYDENFILLYSYDINNGKVSSFKNYDDLLPTKELSLDGETPSKGCYKNCRDKAVAELESDFISDLACSVNPCGIAVAIYCKGKCSGCW